jgi:MarR-like DNA-binding transcriptional regulator SgrR of sgrS sRNA
MSTPHLPASQGDSPGMLLAALQHALAPSGGQGNVTHAWLMQVTGLSRRSIQYGLRALEQQGKVQIISGQGRGKPSVYQLVGD